MTGPVEQALIEAARERRARLYGVSTKPRGGKPRLPDPVSKFREIVVRTVGTDADGIVVPDVPAWALKSRVRCIIERHAMANGTTFAEVVGPRRQRHVVRARQAAMAEVAREFPALSLVRIGRLFGNRDHTTVLHALRKMTAIAEAAE